ncbi:MAG: SurA N-terminal domain-containing protein [Desulfurivibrionaceae bacterium]
MKIYKFGKRITAINIIALIALFTATTGLTREGKLLDRVVAVVNTEVITLSELDKEAAPFLNQIKGDVSDSGFKNQLNQIRQKVLKKMIDHELIRQEAEDENIRVSKEEVNQALARIAESNNASIEEIKDELRSSGASLDNYRKNIRMQILRSRLINRNIRGKIVISDEQIEDYYRNNYNKKSNKDGYHLLQFAAGWGEGGRHESKKEARKFAEKMREKIDNGAGFSEIARQYSDLPSSSEGGDIGFFKKNELAPYMWEAIKDLEPGELSPVMETRSGFQFFLFLGGKKDNTTQETPLEVVREDIRKKLYDKSLEKRFEKWTKELREKAYIEKML